MLRSVCVSLVQCPLSLVHSHDKTDIVFIVYYIVGLVTSNREEESDDVCGGQRVSNAFFTKFLKLFARWKRDGMELPYGGTARHLHLNNLFTLS